jgi:Tfp pilus assembly protein PilF
MSSFRLIPSISLSVMVLLMAIIASGQAVQRRAERPLIKFDRSKEISAEALKSSQAGDPSRAIEIASAALQDCSADEAGSACRELLNYTIGYIYQREAQIAANSADREHALTSATESYRAALKDDPNNTTIHFNLGLALISSGNQAAAISELQKAAQADPTQWQYSIKLGDIQQQQKNWTAAMQAYTQAAESAPGVNAPLQRILEITKRGHGLTSAELQSHCEQWEILHPDISANCYEQLIKMTYQQNNAAAENALIAWLGVVSRQEKIDQQLLDALPKDWKTAAMPPLTAVLRGSLVGLVNNWWTQARTRSEVWARLLLSVGQESSSEPRKMESIWQTALSTVRDEHRSASSLELRRALALLYASHADLDPTGNKLNGLVEQIFIDKMGAIESEDLEAEQRYHTVLALIFAGQQKWGQDDNSHSAAFQARRAIEVADERYQKEGIYQPLPEIKELRVKIYEATGRTTEAQKARWDAALAHMDSDQLDRAGKAIQALQPPEGFDKAQLDTLLKLRRDAGTASAEQKASLITALSTLSARTGVSSDFVQRQQFKALADLVGGGPGAPSEPDSVRAALAAFSLTVDKHVPLIGVNDLSRWQAVQRRLINSVGGRSETIQVRPGGGGSTLKLSLPASTVPQNVEVTSQTLQAAHVVQVLGPEKVVQYSRSMSLSGGKLATPEASPEMRQKLEMRGVKVTAVPQ